MELERTVKVKQKPVTCPKCGSSNILRYLYGEPTYEALLEEREGKLILGGCCVEPSSPWWRCTSCNTDFVKTGRDGRDLFPI